MTFRQADVSALVVTRPPIVTSVITCVPYFLMKACEQSSSFRWCRSVGIGERFESIGARSSSCPGLGRLTRNSCRRL